MTDLTQKMAAARAKLAAAAATPAPAAPVSPEEAAATLMALAGVKARNAVRKVEDVAVLRIIAKRDSRLIVGGVAKARLRTLGASLEAPAEEPTLSGTKEDDADDELDFTMGLDDDGKLTDEERDAAMLPEPLLTEGERKTLAVTLADKEREEETAEAVETKKCPNPECNNEGPLDTMFGYRNMKRTRKSKGGGVEEIIERRVQSNCRSCRAKASQGSSAKARERKAQAALAVLVNDKTITLVATDDGYRASWGDAADPTVREAPTAHALLKAVKAALPKAA